jgi:hypothetical protein
VTQTPNFLITEIASNQNQKEVTANQAFVELEAALSNAITIAMSDADYTLTATENGQALGNLAFVFTGTITALRNVIVPNQKKLYLVMNGTSASLGFSIEVKTSAGTGVTITNGTTAYTLVYCDGVNVVAIA